MRWVALLPATILGFYVGSFLLDLAANPISGLLIDEESHLLDIYLNVGASSFGGGLGASLAAALVAPSRKVLASLAGLVVVLVIRVFLLQEARATGLLSPELILVNLAPAIVASTFVAMIARSKRFNL